MKKFFILFLSVLSTLLGFGIFGKIVKNTNKKDVPPEEEIVVLDYIEGADVKIELDGTTVKVKTKFADDLSVNYAYSFNGMIYDVIESDSFDFSHLMGGTYITVGDNVIKVSVWQADDYSIKSNESNEVIFHYPPVINTYSDLENADIFIKKNEDGSITIENEISSNLKLQYYYIINGRVDCLYDFESNEIPESIPLIYGTGLYEIKIKLTTYSFRYNSKESNEVYYDFTNPDDGVNEVEFRLTFEDGDSMEGLYIYDSEYPDSSTLVKSITDFSSNQTFTVRITSGHIFVLLNPTSTARIMSITTEGSEGSIVSTSGEGGEFWDCIVNGNGGVIMTIDGNKDNNESSSFTVTLNLELDNTGWFKNLTIRDGGISGTVLYSFNKASDVPSCVNVEVTSTILYISVESTTGEACFMPITIGGTIILLDGGEACEFVVFDVGGNGEITLPIDFHY